MPTPWCLSLCQLLQTCNRNGSPAAKYGGHVPSCVVAQCQSDEWMHSQTVKKNHWSFWVLIDVHAPLHYSTVLEGQSWSPFLMVVATYINAHLHEVRLCLLFFFFFFKYIYNSQFNICLLTIKINLSIFSPPFFIYDYRYLSIMTSVSENPWDAKRVH